MGVKQALASAILKLSGWRLVVEEEPPRTGSIFLGAPHTSNFDGVLMLCLGWKLGLDVKWLGKKSLFKAPLGWIVRGLGGIPVDRGNAGGTVERLVGSLESKAESQSDSEGWALVIAPEGTRKKADYWKSGFYRIAVETGLPVVLGFVNGRDKVAGLGPVVHMTGDVKADMDLIRDFYEGIAGVHPGQESVPRLRMEEASDE